MKTKYFIKTITTSLIFPVIIFITAGRIDYVQGYVFLFANLITALMNFWTIRKDIELMTERSKVDKDSKSWDKLILALSGVIYLISVVIAGLDSGRYKWSPDFHWSIYLIGVVLMIIGQMIFLTARKENKYFSSVVRIQKDRGQTVCDTGIYKFVRHPGYLGMIISLAAFPLLTGSIWSTIPIIIAIILLIIRTYLEDEALKKELTGYADYIQKTRQRLIPKIW
ncbi:MAG: isoprenylcysteine carboxylmethyltransferase family protein [Bacteroidales bacterium]|nr:isoprenylcysteine carboxylmethyltransferase family protein [Bacteroidales bacterium]HOK99422.1 isoprenylcysteine carboxylmethyltransferase family protein [Bacteroidales bacterium]HPO64603.1 isoprenylcysteine carboxylmethyltransferase family protein [Bacteroidales bacterium]